MASLLKGIAVTLYDRVETGVDPFGAPVFREVPVTVENVLVFPASAEAVTESMELWGKRAEYELCIPKGDAHVWEDRTVAFFGQRFRTIGFPVAYIEANVPLDWNKKVRVERYG